MPLTAWILGDQLSLTGAALAAIDKDRDVVLMIESLGRARRRPYHWQKLVFVWSAMRHFAEELEGQGYTVDYHRWQPGAAPALQAHLDRHHPSRLYLMDTAEHGRAAALSALAKRLGAAIEVTPNNLFLSDRAAFQEWALGKKTLIMETFYRRMRRQTGLLMDGNDPEGGAWNFDKENRERPPAGHDFPTIPRYEPDAITRGVIDYVNAEFAGHFGEPGDFAWPVTRADAAAFAADFLARRLDLFGPYEDAIVVGERALYHSLLSPLINVGLLDPLALCRQAEQRYYAGQARLNSVEGFIRQLIGWREFVYQVYHLAMPGYPARNFLDADIALPDFYWTADTRMRCVADAVSNLRRTGVNHHIQRLMITGNFALLAGISPQAVNDWYWFAYLDAYEWVVTPNVIGMALYADGGLLATKPYAASANYINKMGDACGDCYFNHRQTTGERACPFNSLYWDFIDRHAERLAENPRMNLILAQHRRKKDLPAIRARAAEIRRRLRDGDDL